MSQLDVEIPNDVLSDLAEKFGTTSETLWSAIVELHNSGLIQGVKAPVKSPPPRIPQWKIDAGWYASS